MNIRRIELKWDPSAQNRVSLIESEISKYGNPLRWAIVSARHEEGTTFVTVEATFDERAKAPEQRTGKTGQGRATTTYGRPVIVHIVPTGIGAAVGGSLGDAMPANLLLSELGTLVTHPNSCNGGPLLLADRNSMIYVEGYSLDEWMKGNLLLNPASRPLSIGVILDSGADQWTIDRAVNAVNGYCAHTGAFVVGMQKTERPVRPSVFRTQDGAFSGKVEDLDAVLEAADKLVSMGAERIAVYTHVSVSNEDWTEYFKGAIPNPVGGVEALISHAVSMRHGIVSAHGPLVSQDEEVFIQSVGQVSPESALEAASPFYLWCVLRGLQDSPDLIPFNDDPDTISAHDVSVVVCPASSLGGIPMLAASDMGKPIVAIRNNTTFLSVDSLSLGFKNVIEVESFIEALGLLSKASEEKDFSMESLRKISATNLTELGSSYIASQGINPLSVIRPSTKVKLYE